MATHMSGLEQSRVNLQQEHESTLAKVQASLKETFAQEIALVQAQHQLELDQLRKQNKEQQEHLSEQHEQKISEYFFFIGSFSAQF